MIQGHQCPAGNAFIGATIYVPSLIIAAIQDDGQGGYEICPDRSGVLTLQERWSEEVRQFNEELHRFLAERSITHMSLRCGAYKGQYLPGPPAFKIETMLQLVPGLTLDLVPKVSVTAWVNREVRLLPEPTGRFGKGRWLTAEKEAIEMAAFVAAHACEQQASSERRTAHG